MAETKEATLELALCDRLDPLGWTGTRTTTDMNRLIAESGAVVRVSEVPGGAAARFQRTPRVRVEIFTTTYATAQAKADQARTLLLTGWFRAGGWTVDRVRVETDFAESFYAEGVRYLSAIFRVTTRS